MGRPGLAAAFQATTIEGLEVVFIVVAIGAGGSGLLQPAMVGAAAALALVAGLGMLLHRPITRVPENTLKRLVGAMLAGFGTFWIGEGAGLAWPGGDASIVLLSLAYLLVSVMAAAWLRRDSLSRGVMKLLRRCLHELWTLFVDDGAVAAWVVAWIVVACLVLQRLPVGICPGRSCSWASRRSWP